MNAVNVCSHFLMLARTLLLIGLASAAAVAVASSASVGAIRVTDAWARATPPGVAIGAAYLVVVNQGADDRLVAAASPVAERVEFHRTSTSGGMARMHQEPAVAIAGAGETVFAPGGRHLMLLGLEQPLAAGSLFPLELTFEHAGTLTLEVEVRAAGAHGHGHDHDHGSGRGQRSHDGH